MSRAESISYIELTLVNKTGEEEDYIKVKGLFYNEDGEQIATAMEETAGLDDGDQWGLSIEVDKPVEEIDRYEVAIELDT